MTQIYGRSPSKEEAEIVAETEGFAELENSPAWKRILERLDWQCEEAQKALDDIKTFDPNVLIAAVQRRKQRVAVKLDLEAFVNEQIERRKEVLTKLAEEHEYTGDYSTPIY